jgi:phi LC3 family holin
MKLNWKVRFKNPVFIVTVFIPGLLLLAQMILAFVDTHITPIGYSVTDDSISGFMAIVNFVALTFFGIGGIVDPTVKGMSDSNRVLNRDEPV